MNDLDMQVINTHLAANVNEKGDITFCENSVMIPTEGSDLNAYFGSDSKFMQSNGDSTFIYLDPQYNYLHGPYSFDEQNLNPTFKCYADEYNLVVTITWNEGEREYGLLGSKPQSAEDFPAAGYLALEELQKRVTDKKAYKKAEDDLFKAIGDVICPDSHKVVKQARRLYREDLNRHHEAGTFPLKGAQVQSGIRCMINGELHVLTHYGVAKVSYGAYGNLVMDTSFDISVSEDSCSIDMRVFCNSEAPVNFEYQGSSTAPDHSGAFSVYYFPEVYQALCTYYKDLNRVKDIFAGVLCEVCFHNSSLSLQSRWLYVSEVIETVTENPLDSSIVNTNFIKSLTADSRFKSASLGIFDHCPMSSMGIKEEVRFTRFACESDSRLQKWTDGEDV